MTSEIVVCNDIGPYLEALTRGNEYEVIAEDEEKEQFKIKGDNNRSRWFKKYYFVSSGISVPVIVSWKFDDSVEDSSANSLEHIEISILFNDGQTRWCSICTKSGLMDYLERNMDGNVYLIENQIIVRSFSYESVNDALNDLDQHNQLIISTKSLN